MGQQVLDGLSSHALAPAASAIACVLAAAPGPDAVARLHATAWPTTGTESLRGAALLAESRLSAESLARLSQDYHRLFVGSAQRRPVAFAGAPALAEPSLTQLRFELAQTGAPLGCATGTDLADALHTLAALSVSPAQGMSLEWRRELLEDHLLTWGAVCLSRVQLGAQTFFYQGVAALGLGLLRQAATIT